VLLENERFNLKEFKKSWFDGVKVTFRLFSIWLSDLAISLSAEQPWPRFL
jgi:hypothetical protein